MPQAADRPHTSSGRARAHTPHRMLGTCTGRTRSACHERSPHCRCARSRTRAPVDHLLPGHVVRIDLPPKTECVERLDPLGSQLRLLSEPAL
eukprot:scaffold204095_cov21-Tisochrysis_lutea.AAC.1